MTTLVGIDLSVQPADTGVVVVETDADGQLESVTFDRDRRATEGLQQLIQEVTGNGGLAAVDVPLGWPQPFRELFADRTENRKSFREFESKRAEGQEHSLPFEMLRYRDTDRWLRGLKLPLEDSKGGFVQPKSAASDKLGATTMRWQAIRAGLDNRNAARAIECYPAAARAMWRYRSAPSPTWLDLDVAAWRRTLQDAFGFELATTGRRTPLNTHEKDAYIAAMVASSYVRGETTCVHSGDSSDARTAHAANTPPEEGCIVLPSDPLDEHPLTPAGVRADG